MRIVHTNLFNDSDEADFKAIVKYYEDVGSKNKPKFDPVKDGRIKSHIQWMADRMWPFISILRGDDGEVLIKVDDDSGDEMTNRFIGMNDDQIIEEFKLMINGRLN